MSCDIGERIAVTARYRIGILGAVLGQACPLRQVIVRTINILHIDLVFNLSLNFVVLIDVVVGIHIRNGRNSRLGMVIDLRRRVRVKRGTNLVETIGSNHRVKALAEVVVRTINNWSVINGCCTGCQSSIQTIG